MESCIESVIFRRPKTHNFHVNQYSNNTVLLGYVWFLLVMYISWSRLCSLMIVLFLITDELVSLVVWVF